MPTQYWGLEWLNANSQRSYPFAEGSRQLDVSGTFEIPADFLVGCSIPVHAGLAVQPEKFFVRELTNFGAEYVLNVAYDDGGNQPIVATAVISRTQVGENVTYQLTGVDDFDDVIGQIVVGRLDTINQQPAGAFRFAYAAGQLDPDCVRPSLQALSSFRVVSDEEISPRIYGDFELVIGNNLRATIIRLPGQPPQVRLDAISGEGLNSDCECADESDVAPPIRYINDVYPDTDGGMTFEGTNCLTIAPITNGLVFDDRCSKPCCGCAELETITEDLQRVAQGVAALQTLLAKLEQSNTTLATTTATTSTTNVCG